MEPDRKFIARCAMCLFPCSHFSPIDQESALLSFCTVSSRLSIGPKMNSILFCLIVNCHTSRLLLRDTSKYKCAGTCVVVGVVVFIIIMLIFTRTSVFNSIFQKY